MGIALRRAALAAAGIALVAGVAPAHAYPVKPARIIVPAAPGGGMDTTARLAAQKLAERLGQPFIVDNRPGAGGSIGTTAVAKAAPDGYTLLLAFVGQVAMLPHVEKVDYVPTRDFSGVSQLASSYHMIAVHPSLPARTVGELVALAKRRPGELNYAAGNFWSPAHLATELFKSVTGTSVVPIHYKGSAPAVVGLLTGEAQMMFGSYTAVMPHLKTKRLVALAVTSPVRSPMAPEVPTLVESGVRGVEVPLWYAIVAPAATPREIVTRLHGELARVAASRDYREQLEKQALEPQASTPEQFDALLRSEFDKWGKVIRALKTR